MNYLFSDNCDGVVTTSFDTVVTPQIRAIIGVQDFVTTVTTFYYKRVIIYIYSIGGTRKGKSKQNAQGLIGNAKKLSRLSHYSCIIVVVRAVAVTTFKKLLFLSCQGCHKIYALRSYCVVQKKTRLSHT